MLTMQTTNRPDTLRGNLKRSERVWGEGSLGRKLQGQCTEASKSADNAICLDVANAQADAQSRHNQANCKDDDRRQVGNTSHDRVVIEQNGESGGSYTAEFKRGI